jgi:hypothetical protein
MEAAREQEKRGDHDRAKYQWFVDELRHHR